MTIAVGEKLADIVEMINNADSSSESDNDEDFEVRRRTSSSKSKKTSETAAVKSSHVSRGKNKPTAVII